MRGILLEAPNGEKSKAPLRVLQSFMEVPETVTCPYCGQRFELMIDTTEPSQEFVTDCEVCCRPFAVQAECEPGEVTSLDVREA